MHEWERLLEDYTSMLMKTSSPDRPAWNIEQIRLGKKPGWNYIDGIMIRGMLEHYSIRRNSAYLDFADGFIDHYVRDDGSIIGYEPETYNIDNINEGKVLFDLLDHTGKEKYRLALDAIRSQLNSHPRISRGNFWHKKIYPHQVWLDGLYMALPFLAEYETRQRNWAAYDDIFSQFSTVVELMRDRGTGLYFHGYDESKSMYWADPQSGCSPNFWLRALGWFAMAMVDVLEKLDSRHCSGKDTVLASHFRNLMDSLLAFQDRESGMWYQLVNLPQLEGNYLETSGSAILSYALLKAVRLGILPGSYEVRGVEAFEGICRNRLSLKDGALSLGGICLMAGLGGDEKRDGSIAYYLSEPVVENDAKGVGPLLLAYTEMIRR